jgi:hypothetical protein
MSSDDHHHHHHHHHHHGHKVLEKLTNKISALKEDITEAVRDRSHSTTSDRRNSMSNNHNSATINNVTFSLQDDVPSVNIETRQTFKSYGM